MIFFVVMFFYLVNTKVPGIKVQMYDQRLSAISSQSAESSWLNTDC